jgi:acetyl esterase/lipase
LSASPPPRLDVPFARTAERSLFLDLHPPGGSDPSPVVIWLHPGAWREGSRRDAPPLDLLAHGFAVAPIDYRLSHEAHFPAQLHDVKTAIRWLRAHAADLGVDGGRIGVFGASAGGHLAALAGLTGNRPDLDPPGASAHACAVQAVCDWYGPTAFLSMNDQAGEGGRIDHDAPDSPESELIGGPIRTLPDGVAAASPLTYVHPEAPPFLIMHGDRDAVVAPGQSRLLHEALEAAGVQTTLKIVPGAGHALGNEHLETVARFFAAHLKAG